MTTNHPVPPPPPADPAPSLRPGVDLIAAERQRQIDAEGHHPGHDSAHADAELIDAAICYLTAPRFQAPVRRAVVISHGPAAGQPWTPIGWPWEPSAWKPTPNDRVRELVKAGALIAAEIDRLTEESR